MSNPVFRFATVQGQNIHWFLKRNCSVTPAQLGWLYASLCVVSLGTAAVFWFQQLVVEVESAGHLERAEFNREWVRVEPLAGDRSLIELSGQGRRVNVGRYLRPELRPVLAQEIRRALREARGV